MKKIVFLPVILLLVSCGTQPEYPRLTACLREKQVVMFGASWCPHCAEQKKLFGKSAKDMPYFECSQNGKQVPECDSRGIMSYPTWQFPESSLQNLPPEAQMDILNTESEKVRGTSALYYETLKTKDTAAATRVQEFEKKTEELLSSKLTVFEKLKKLTVLTQGPTNSLIDRPVYVSGRLSGERTLANIALYSGCSEAYQQDIEGKK